MCILRGWGGTRTHKGINPHDFQSCALSRSATHPNSDQTGDSDPTLQEGAHEKYLSHARGK